MVNLRAIRKAKGFSCAKLAAAVGVLPRRLARWEALDNEPPREMRIALADALHVSLDELEGRAPLPSQDPAA